MPPRQRPREVWGGGTWLPQSWYDACDELGVLVYHDMMFAVETGQPHLAYVSDVVEAELRYQIRRLSAHPSIAMCKTVTLSLNLVALAVSLTCSITASGDGCNECQVLLDTPTGIYASFVMTVVAEEDASRAIWPSCPARKQPQPHCVI